ncbi:hypothetical protein HFD88_003228 [Aspergillus terreus]|nr:hypothetical protein HFD88_003228 [Aspergillus terreus]
MLEVPSMLLEQTSFEKTPTLWSSYYRTILDDPRKDHQSISGICSNDSIYGRPAAFRPFRYIPPDPQTARILGTARGSNKASISFCMATMFEPDLNREMGRRIGYPVHVHCWMLMDRVIGHDAVKEHLSVFIEALHNFWSTRSDIWGIDLVHEPEESPCYDEGDQYWLRRHRIRDPPLRWLPKVHGPGNPVHIQGMEALIARATQTSDSDADAQPQRRYGSIFANVPLEIVEYMVDVILETQPNSEGAPDDIRNMLEAFQWKLPGSYWRSRCPVNLLFELDDLSQKGATVNWGEVWFELEQLLFRREWYCESGLKNRGRTLKMLYDLKYCFLNTLKGG